MKVAIIGSAGMLGTDLVAACKLEGIEALERDLPAFDICSPDCPLDDLLGCDQIINCAAYTDVDGAETNRDTAFAVNSSAAGRIAEWCSKNNVKLLHISTDYVFDGSGKSSFSESDPVNPLGAYGESKLAGEQAVQNAGENHLIIRTQSLFGKNGKNFVRAISARLEQGDSSLEVVSDQTSCPTYTAHLAGAIIRLLKLDETGTVHVSASGECSWHEFALAICAKVKPETEVIPVSAEKYARAASRPPYSVLDKSLYKSWTNHEMPSWQQGLEEYLKEIG